MRGPSAPRVGLDETAINGEMSGYCPKSHAHLFPYGGSVYQHVW